MPGSIVVEKIIQVADGRMAAVIDSQNVEMASLNR